MIHLGIKKFDETQSEFRIEQRLAPYTQPNPELVRAIATGAPPDLVVINDPDLAGFLLSSGLMAAGHDGRIIGSDLLRQPRERGLHPCRCAIRLSGSAVPCCRHDNEPAAARAITCRRRRRVFRDCGGMVITPWYPTAPISLRRDTISYAGAGCALIGDFWISTATP
jgi:hypothetical protein